VTAVVPETAHAARVRHWYRDPISCLQSTLATVLLRAGVEPLPVLGLGWEFLFKPGDVRPEEFYYPCRFEGDVARSLAPYHPIRSSWWSPALDEDPLAELARRVEDGELPVAAVDNYHLPFRPAFRDVHAAHLVVVYAVDRRREEIHVSDAMPPAFQGAIAAADFLASWSSANPPDDEDAFFSDSTIGRRCLSVEIEGALPPLAPERLRAALDENLARFGGGGWSGLAGLHRYVEELAARAQAGERRPLEELYPFGWGMQAQTYLHGELLREVGAAWALRELAEAGRAVQEVASAWTGLRMTGAHGLSAPAAAAADLRRHGSRLRHRYETALERVAPAVESL
jgi:Butirosin biosynthesis protein H, N-terminal